ncbi:MAG: DUF3108 domain-containing protein [bacterium]
MISLLFLLCFNPGEKLEYEAKWSFLTLGTMTLEIIDTIDYNGSRCYHISSLLISNPSLDFLFTLHDTIEVYTRTDDLLPIYYREMINEGKYTNHSELVFNHDSLCVTYDDTLTVRLLENSRDLLSFWYYLRTIDLEVGDTIPINIHKSQENHEIMCFIVEEKSVKTSLGEFNTILVSPQTQGKGIFGSGGGMDIWYSRDQNRYPVLIKAKIKSGSILFKLKGVTN